jgi:hypothetical protein
MFRALDVFTAFSAQMLRFPSGIRVAHVGPRPELLLELYEFEGCPFCRKVREMLTTLDLDAAIFPCPKGGTRFRPARSRSTASWQFPLPDRPEHRRGDLRVRRDRAVFGGPATATARCRCRCGWGR